MLYASRGFFKISFVFTNHQTARLSLFLLTVCFDQTVIKRVLRQFKKQVCLWISLHATQQKQGLVL